ncbi:MAG: DUF2927 domain-containing protein [Alphaproteobacteria bacterium]|nr:MAG: DUF2927 domain-containing protein [Alphaproteobacteria bacterium]
MRRAAMALALLLSACAGEGAQYYADLQADLRARGFLRTERAPVDAPFTDADLIRNFRRIALYSEFRREGGRFVAERTPVHLSKWLRPIRIAVYFGASVAPGQQRQDLADVARFSARLARLSGLDIALLADDTAGAANFVILYANRNERVDIARSLAGTNAGFDPAILADLRDGSPDKICFANTFENPDRPGELVYAMVVIKAETSGLLRLSCLHEELTQALGLANDDPRVRPSIFNDDEEFALLTAHDEMLLRMLYHPRLQPGMEAEEVVPLLPGILADVKRTR